MSAPQAVEGLSCRRYIQPERELHMEEMYEVMKFVEHGEHCRQSMDCVRGTTLLACLKEEPRVGKATLFRWFRELAVSVDQFHRCRNGQDYRYLNPCSIIVTEEGGLMLLDMEAPDNSAAARQMQTGAVREHFVKPVYRMGVTRNHEADLYAYGKTLQFMLACTDVSPSLSRWEELRLERLIARCTGEKKPRFEDMRQVVRALPAPAENRMGRRRAERTVEGSKTGYLPAAAAGAAACLIVCLALDIGRQGVLKSYADTGGNMPAAVREEMLLAYDRLLELERDRSRIEETAVKKMRLEAEAGETEEAIRTGRAALKKTGGSEEIAGLLEEYGANGME